MQIDYYRATRDRWEREAQDLMDQAKKAFFAEIARYPLVVTVEATYDGSNDEGQIDAIAYRDAAGTEIAVDATMEQAAEAFIDLAIDAVAGDGWDNGDGAQGEVTIDVATRKTVVVNRAKYTAYDESTGEL